jgi:succinate dehydrogenase hydrophobic anchor subunit
LAMGARYQMDLGTLMRWTFFPNPNHVVNSNIPDITMGWANAFWQTIQVLIVFFGATHGFNGLRVVLEEYIHPPFWVTLLRLLLGVLWLGTLIIGVFVILAS